MKTLLGLAFLLLLCLPTMAQSPTGMIINDGNKHYIIVPVHGRKFESNYTVELLIDAFQKKYNKPVVFYDMDQLDTPLVPGQPVVLGNKRLQHEDFLFFGNRKYTSLAYKLMLKTNCFAGYKQVPLPLD